MALPPDSIFRGVAAAIPQPTTEQDALNQLSPIRTGLTMYNPEVPRIVFRNPDNDQDIIEKVYRWDTRPFEEIFVTGFRRRPPIDPRHLEDYFNLEQSVNRGGRPVDETPAQPSVFVSTTRSTSWRPMVTAHCILYRYEIFAPGGIDAVLTLGDRNRYRNQQEISFAGGISPQYIRTARVYGVTRTGPLYTSYTLVDLEIRANALFNPNPDANGGTTMGFFNRLRNPVCPAEGDVVKEYPAREKRSTGKIHVEDLCNVGHYIESAFSFYKKDEVYLFISNRCLLINYAPHSTDDYIIKRPQSIGDILPYLKDTIFASGIDAAFTSSNENVAYIFRSNIYARINFDGGFIIQGPKLITDSFCSLKNTIFEKGIDAAFTSSQKNKAYIFRGNQYALINFVDDSIIRGPKNITQSFYSLKGTIFQNGLDAAFSSSREEEAYIFKGDTYALINFAPDSTNDKIIIGPKKITESFYSLKDILPMKPCACS